MFANDTFPPSKRSLVVVIVVGTGFEESRRKVEALKEEYEAKAKLAKEHFEAGKVKEDRGKRLFFQTTSFQLC